MTTLDFNNSYVERMRIDRNGNVGIGTNKLAPHVTDNNGAIISSSETTGNRTAILRLGSPYQTNHDAYCLKLLQLTINQNNYNSDLRFYTSVGNNADATERMTILSGGNIGIGTTNPTKKLEVDGKVKATEFEGNGVTPIGGIIMWSGSLNNDGTVPNYSNWRICDGTNNTPDLRGRFIMGSTNENQVDVAGEGQVNYETGQTGGQQHVTLTTAEMPTHNHTMQQAGSHSHEMVFYNGNDLNWTESGNPQTDDNQNIQLGTDDAVNYQGVIEKGTESTLNAGDHTHTINQSGQNGSHENIPPYYVLAYIMRIS